MPDIACFRLRNPRLHLATWVLMGLTVSAAYAEEGVQATPAAPPLGSRNTLCRASQRLQRIPYHPAG